MPFPSVVGTSNGTTGASTSHSISLPGASAGQLLLVFFGCEATSDIDPPGDWIELIIPSSYGAVTLGIFYKTAAGADSLTLTTADSVPGGYAAFAIDGWSDLFQPGANSGTDEFPDPQYAGPGWGAEDILWIAAAAHYSGTYPDAYPSGYGDNQNTQIFSTGILSVASRDLNASSEDPGAFDLASSVDWLANVVAIRPAQITELIGEAENLTEAEGVLVVPALLVGEAESGSEAEGVLVVPALLVGEAESGSEAEGVLVEAASFTELVGEAENRTQAEAIEEQSMSVTLTGGSGLFDRLGQMGGLIDIINARRGGGSAGDFDKELNDILLKYDGKPNYQKVAVENLVAELESLQAGMASMLFRLKAAAQIDLINSFHFDDPLPELTVTEALLALDRQMRTATTRYVEPNTLGSSFTSSGNTGNGVVVACLRDGRGVPLENLLAEDLTVTVIDNSTAGAETLRIRGEVNNSDKLHWLWPEGSGSDGSLTSMDAASDDNLLANGTFETFTVANTPDDWTIVVGAAGADILSEAVTVFAGAKALEFLGDGSTLTQIKQTIADLESLTNYCLNFWCRVSSAPSQGVLVADLWDGSAVIQDEEGNNQTVSIDLTILGTTFVAKQLCFRLPEPVPATVAIRLRLSTALENAKSVFIDHACLQVMEQLGSVPGHVPYLAAFGGSTGWALDDGLVTKVLKLALTNDRASQWQALFDKLFDTADLGVVLPTSGTTIIDDNLIA